MTYEERTSAIGTLLRETILPRYQRPEYLDDATARAELRDMVEDINAEWPIMSPSRFAETSERFARAVRVSNASRKWPTIGTLCKALKAALQVPAPVVTNADDEPPHIYEMVREWWLKFRDAGPGGLPKPHHAARLIADGAATPGQLRRGGFPLTGLLLEQAMTEPDPNHPAILGEITALADELKQRHAPQGNVMASAPKHWLNGATADDPRHEAVRRARAANALMHGEPA